jgi:predicted nucleotide-binding protein
MDRMPTDPPDLPEWLQPSVLKLPLEDARSQLENLVIVGRSLKKQTQPQSAYDETRRRIGEWRESCRMWLGRNLGGRAADEFTAARAHPYEYEAPSAYHKWRYMQENVDAEVATLASILQRLDQWVPGDIPSSAARARESRPSANPPDFSPFSSTARPSSHTRIFIVHGHDTPRASMVAREVENATKSKATILWEQARRGRTLIELFERHAAEASYAIVILTPDDAVSARGQTGKSLRARQNVIFELGYFYGALGRERVSILCSPGVEIPSDINGIGFISFEDNGAWRAELFQELRDAGIYVDLS